MKYRTPIQIFLMKIVCALGASAIYFAAGTMAHLAAAQPGGTPPGSGMINPQAIVFSPATGKVYAVETNHGTITIYNDALRQSHRVKVGSAPVSIAANEVTGRIYVANAGDGTVSVVDGNSDAVVATVPVGIHPYSIAVNSKTNKVYVTHTYLDAISILDGETNTATNLKAASADLVSIDPDTNTIYLLGYEGGTINALDGLTQIAHKLEAGKHAWGMTIDRPSGALYIARLGTGDVASLRDASTASTFLSGNIPCAIAINSATHKIYVANYGDNTVAAIDLKSKKILATIPVGTNPEGIALDSELNLVFVANTHADTITVIDTVNNSVLATLPAGRSPHAIAVVPGSRTVYVADESGDTESIAIDIATVRK
jgi:YVTN family beta-propeller protein